MYSRGKIYKLVNDVDNLIYIGSTCNRLCKRLGDHKSSAKVHKERLVYKHLNEIGWENVQIILVEKFECKTKEELRARERYWIETLEAKLNKQIPTRTKKEIDKKYREENKEKVKETQRLYRDKNKEELANKSKEYRTKKHDDITKRVYCDCGGYYQFAHKYHHTHTKKHKEWENNSDSD